MKYMMIRGSKSSGKSVTVTEICRRLRPQAVKKIYFKDDGQPVLENAEDLTAYNYIATVKNKRILIVAKSPTEQKLRVTTILEAVNKLNIHPEFAIVSVSGLEKLKDFSTVKELENFGQCIFETKIHRIPARDYRATEEWNKRVAYLTTVASHYI